MNRQRIRWIVCFLVVFWCQPLWAQAPPGADRILESLEAEGYFEKCRQGEMRGCSYFVRLFALRMNPTGNPNAIGTLTKPAGGSNVEGYADDAIALNANPSDLHNVIDLVGGAGAPGARIQWGGPHPRRVSDVWEAPKPLTDAQMQYLRPGSSPSPTPSPTPPPSPPTSLQPVLDAIAALNAKLDSLSQDVMQARVSADGAALDAKAASVKIEGVAATVNDTRQRIETIVEQVDALRNEVAAAPTYRGRVLGFPVTLEPVRP